jgi:HAMP domain-containing protein
LAGAGFAAIFAGRGADSAVFASPGGVFLIILVAIFAIIFVILNLLLHFLVVTPVKRVSGMADAVSLGDDNVEVYIKPGKDEISSLSVSFNRMRESLKHAMDMIK